MKKFMSLAACALLLAASNGCSVCDGTNGGCDDERFSLGRLLHRDRGCNACSTEMPACQSCGLSSGYSGGTIIEGGHASAPCNCGGSTNVGYAGGTIISGEPPISGPIGAPSLPSGGFRSAAPGPMSE
ncbi:MAG: hypothetical protein QM811_05160 [Pirellulales bacterium]